MACRLLVLVLVLVLVRALALADIFSGGTLCLWPSLCSTDARRRAIPAPAPLDGQDSHQEHCRHGQ